MLNNHSLGRLGFYEPHVEAFNAVFEGFDASSFRMPAPSDSLLGQVWNWVKAYDCIDPDTYPDERLASEIYLEFVKERLSWETTTLIESNSQGLSRYINPADFEDRIRSIAREFIANGARSDLDASLDVIEAATYSVIEMYRSDEMSFLNGGFIDDLKAFMDRFEPAEIMRRYGQTVQSIPEEDRMEFIYS